MTLLQDHAVLLRNKAEECRSMSARLQLQAAREVLLLLAQSYDHRAMRLERADAAIVPRHRGWRTVNFLV